MTGGIRTNTDLKEIANMFGAGRQLQRENNLHNCRWYTIIYLVLQEISFSFVNPYLELQTEKYLVLQIPGPPLNV